MPNWKEILDETRSVGSPFDLVRRRYLANLSSITGRNVIIYYSGWLQKQELLRQGLPVGIDDSDKNGFMAAINKLDRTKGLDLVLHTPGGEIAATESIVDYLRSMFGTDIRAIIPQISMSAGTMISLSCKEVIMGKHSSLGPIDPQIHGLPAHGIIEEFKQAFVEMQQDPKKIAIWQPIIAKYNPTLIGECQKAIDWSNEIVKRWLETGMFAGDPQASAHADKIIAELGDHVLTKSHARHISLDKAQGLGIKVKPLESDPSLQDGVLSLHHSCIQTLAGTQAYKMIENQLGVAFIQQSQPVLVGPA